VLGILVEKKILSFLKVRHKKFFLLGD